MSKKQTSVYRIANIKDYRKVYNFVINNWKKNHYFCRDQSFFKWTYLTKKNFNFAIAETNSVIVGVLGFINQSKFDDKLPKNQIFLTLSVTNKLAKPGSVFKLLETIKKKFKPTLISSSGAWNNKLTKLNKLIGFNVKLMNHYFILGNKKKFKLTNIKKYIKHKIFEKKIFFSQINERNIIKKNNKFFGKYPKKSLVYLLNRYLKHPIFNYLIFEISYKKNLKCILVLRQIKIKNSNFFKIIDYIGDKKNFHLIGSVIKHILMKYKPEFIDIVCRGISKKKLTKLGFKNKNDYKNLILPDYTSPLVMKNVDIKSGVIIKKSFINKILIMRGDGDRDNPS